MVEDLIYNELTAVNSYQLANQSFWIGLFREDGGEYYWLQDPSVKLTIENERFNSTQPNDRYNLKCAIKILSLIYSNFVRKIAFF